MKIDRISPRVLALAAAGLGSLLILGVAGCNGCASSSGTSTAQTADGSTTDAAANSAAADGGLAPVEGQPTQVLGQSASYTPQQQGESYSQQQPAPIVQGSGQQSYSTADPTYNNTDVNEEAGEDALTANDIQADQPPPPLPEYDQPPAPEPDYLWTPGYWAYGTGGYYWTPGVWCPPPYYGALWTPPYWGYYGGHYRFHRGYWGPHIGFYGGIDYGFGYIGIGYFGGYWQGHNFYYNRLVTNVNVNVVHNVYNREVVYNNVHYGRGIQDRVSYNGGRGGLNVAPRPQEIVALRETHTPALREQVQVRTLAAGNRAQFYDQNHGRPAQAVLARPVAVSHQIGEAPRAVQQEQQRSATIQQHNQQAQPQRGAEPARGAEPQRGVQPGQPQQRGPEPQHGPEPQRGTEPQQHAPEPGRPAAQPQHTQPFQPRTPTESRQVPIERAQPQQQQRQEPQQQSRPQPQQQRTEPQQAPRPQPQEQPRPQPQARPQPVARPQPEARPQPQQAPRPQPEARPQPQARPAPAPHPPEQHGGHPPR